MKLKELILLEQSIADGKTAQEYKDAGYDRIAKGLINDKKKTGDVKTDVDGKSWYKATATATATVATGLSQYVGSYKGAGITGDVTDKNGTLTVSFSRISGDLVSKGGDNFEFTVMGKTGTVKFTKDAQGKVNGFDYSWTTFNGHADKVDATATSTTNTNTTTPVKKADESKFACILIQHIHNATSIDDMLGDADKTSLNNDLLYIVFIFYPLRFTHQKNSQKIHALKTNTYIKEGKVLTHKNNPQITF